MGRVAEFTVDLQDAARRDEVARKYLALGVCPVEGQSPPPMLSDVRLTIVVAADRVLTRTGRVVQKLGDAGFVVHLDGPIGPGDLPPAAPEREAVPDAEPVPAPQLEPVPAPVTPAGETADLWVRIREMSLVEKQRLARHGKKPARQLLIKDLNKTLHALVIANPETTQDEIVEYSSLPGLAKDAIALIVRNRTWLASRMIVLNLVRNPSTPSDTAVRLVSLLGKNEWRVLARPGGAHPAVAAQARKLLLEM